MLKVGLHENKNHIYIVFHTLDTKSKINKLDLKTSKNIDKNLENSFGVHKFKNTLFNDQIIIIFFQNKL